MKEKMENVLNAFSTYLEGNDQIDIVFSKKHGYLFLWFNENGECEGGICIENEVMLCEFLFSEIRKEICRTYSPDSDEGIAITRRTIEPYCLSLSGYQSILDSFIESLSD